MANFLLASMPVTGHFAPGIPIARSLVDRGHRVRWYTSSRFADAVRAAGATHVPMTHGYDFDDSDLDAAFPGRERLRGLAQLEFDMMKLFLGAVPGQLRDIEDELGRHPTDVVVGDLGCLAPLLSARRNGHRTALYGITPLVFSSRDTPPFGLGLSPRGDALGQLRNAFLHAFIARVPFRRVNRAYRKLWLERSGEPAPSYAMMDVGKSADLLLHATVPAFEYPRRDLPSNVRFVGAFAPEPPRQFERPPWWGELDHGRRVVYVTQGTIATAQDQLIRPALDALADEDVLVVVTTGARRTLQGPVPANARVANFIPHAVLMPKVTAMVSNGGYGGVQHALMHGVPLVVAGATEDKPEIAEHVAWSGAGLRLRGVPPQVGDLRGAVRRVLDEPRFAARAQQLATEYARFDAARVSVEALEGLVARARGARRVEPVTSLQN